MRHEGVFDQVEVYLLHDVLDERGDVPHHPLLVDVGVDPVQQCVDLELVGRVEVHGVQFSVIAELVELRHQVVFDVVVEELLEFARYECEVDLCPFEVVQDHI